MRIIISTRKFISNIMGCLFSKGKDQDVCMNVNQNENNAENDKKICEKRQQSVCCAMMFSNLFSFP